LTFFCRLLPERARNGGADHLHHLFHPLAAERPGIDGLADGHPGR
jgi:hypothetical protein